MGADMNIEDEGFRIGGVGGGLQRSSTLLSSLSILKEVKVAPMSDVR